MSIVTLLFLLLTKYLIILCLQVLNHGEYEWQDPKSEDEMYVILKKIVLLQRRTDCIQKF